MNSERITVYCTPEQKQLIYTAALMYGVDVSSLLKYCFFSRFSSDLHDLKKDKPL